MVEPFAFFWPNILFQLVPLGLLLIVAVTVSSVRHDADPKGKRLTATYFSVVMFLFLFIALAGATAAVASLASLVGEESSGVELFSSETEFGDEEDDFEEDEGNEEAAAGAVQGVFVAATAGGVLLYYRRQMLELLEDEAGDAHEDDAGDHGVATRIAHAYFYVTSSVALLVFVIAGAIGLFGFAKVLVPDALSTDEVEATRDEGAREVFAGGFAAVASLAIVALHKNERERMDEDDGDDVPEPPDEQETPAYPIA